MGIFDQDFVERLRALPVSARAAKARDALLERGSVSTEELADMGYNHPPRAIADLKEAGVAISTESTTSRTGRRIARYRLLPEITEGRKSRKSIPKKFREELNLVYGQRCAICHGKFENRELQADHRVPFWIAGDSTELNQDDFMPLCASDNRSKSWSCEQCRNFQTRNAEMCRSCFWAHPENYSHIAGEDAKTLQLTVRGEDANLILQFEQEANAKNMAAGELLLQILKERFTNSGN